MQPLELNLASRPFKNDTLPWLAASVAGAALLGATVWNVQSYRDNSLWAADLRQQYSDRDRELVSLGDHERKTQQEIEQIDRELLAIRADKANEVIRWKGFSWTRLFNHMEEVLPNDVQMTSIRPLFRPENPEEESNLRKLELEGRVPVSVEGTAKTIMAFFEFERNLYAHPHFDQVDPERTDTDENTGSTLFSLRFLYDPRELPSDAGPGPDLAAELEGAGGEPAAAEAGGEPSLDVDDMAGGLAEGAIAADAIAEPPGLAADATGAEVAAGAATDPVTAAGTETTVRSFGNEPTEAAPPEEEPAPAPPPREPRRGRKGGAGRRGAGGGG